MRIIRYFFPRRTLRDRVPPVTRGFTPTDGTIYGRPVSDAHTAIRHLIASRAARNSDHAWFLLSKHPSLTIPEIISLYRRERRRGSIVRRLWRRLRALWIISIVTLMIPARANAQDPRQGIVRDTVKVRACPRVECEQIGVLKIGGRVIFDARDEAGKWLFFQYWGTPAWVSTWFIDIADPMMLPTYDDNPPSPATPPPGLSITQYTMDPIVPRPGEWFILKLTIVSASDVGAFAVAGANGDQFLWASIPKFPAGEGTVSIQAKALDHTGEHTIPLVIDPDMQLGQPLPEHEMTVRYWVDRPRLVESRIEIIPNTNYDLHGGTTDFYLDGTGIHATGGAQLAIISNIVMTDVHFDLLEGVKGEHVLRDSFRAGSVIGILTSEGRRGAIEVVAVGEGIDARFAIYPK
ncbi:MAG: SH3 domain-containing protein [Anaerolineales bacterium]|nr:SH3 domain-containing protein [Anaerolineales bacterium]